MAVLFILRLTKEIREPHNSKMIVKNILTQMIKESHTSPLYFVV